MSKDKQAMQRLKDAAEKAKIELSSTTKTNINLPFITADATGPKHLDVDLTRAKFDALTESLVKKTLKPMEQAMKDAQVSSSDINRVILVGGSTRIPAVVEAVKNIRERSLTRASTPTSAWQSARQYRAACSAARSKTCFCWT